MDHPSRLTFTFSSLSPLQMAYRAAVILLIIMVSGCNAQLCTQTGKRYIVHVELILISKHLQIELFDFILCYSVSKLMTLMADHYWRIVLDLWLSYY